MVDPRLPRSRRHWEGLVGNPSLGYDVAGDGGQIVTTCTLTSILDLIRSFLPYGLIENVVTDPEFRQKGYATEVLHLELREAWEAGCYQVMPRAVASEWRPCYCRSGPEFNEE